MESLRLLATLLPLSVSSGLNLYATIFTASVAIHFGWLKNTPQSLEVLGAWPILIISGIFFLLEIFADKVPYIEHLWDLLHTVIRPLGAGFLAVAVLGSPDPVVTVLAALFAGTIALVSHGGKATSRLAVNAISPVENVSNVALSVAEDVAASGLTVLALSFPFHATGLALILLGAIVLFVPILVRWAWFSIKSVFMWVFSLIQKLFCTLPKEERLPEDHQFAQNIQHPFTTLQCQAVNLTKMAGSTGFLTLDPARLCFTRESKNGIDGWMIDRINLHYCRLQRNWFSDTLTIGFADPKGRTRSAKFTAYKTKQVIIIKMVTQINETRSAASSKEQP